MLPNALLGPAPAQAQALRRLQEIERRLDEAIKRSEARRSIRRVPWIGSGPSAAGLMRIFVEHSKIRQQLGAAARALHQPQTGEVWWQLHVEGRLIDDGSDEPMVLGRDQIAKRLIRRGSFGTFVDRVEVSTDRRAKPPGPNLIWTPPARVPCDGIVLRRLLRTAKPSHVRVSIFLRSSPRRYKMSAPLQKVVKGYRDDLTRDAVLAAISCYADRHNLRSNPVDKREITCDDDLRSCFGVNSFLFSQLADMITPHLEEADPVVFDYVIPGGETQQPRPCDSAPQFADVLVDVPLTHNDDNPLDQAPRPVTSSQLELVCLDSCDRATIQAGHTQTALRTSTAILRTVLPVLRDRKLDIPTAASPSKAAEHK